MAESGLLEVPELQSIKGVPFPADVSFRQVIVTGPPGVGKTRLLTTIGGWPEEGFLDLAKRNWWRQRALTFRPRQLHFMLPFEGHRRSLSVFEDEWLDGGPPRLDLDRVQIPPLGGRRDPWKWRRKYVFDFLLPPAEAVFEARQERSDRHSHEIDVEISLHLIEAQLETYRAVARFFHHAGLVVYVRDRFGGPPKTFRQPSAASLVESREARPRAGRSPLQSYIKRIISPRGYRVLDRFERVNLVGKRVLVPRRILPVELTMGPQKLRIDAEDGLEPGAALADSVRVFDPTRYFNQISPFSRLMPDGILRLPGEHALTQDLPDEVPARVEITNEGDWITVVDLDSPTGTAIVALDDAAELERLADDRSERLARLLAALDGLPPIMSKKRAAKEYAAVIHQLEKGRYRPRDSRGQPGGLVELPDSLVPIVVGDLHAEVDNLLLALSEGRFLDEIEKGAAALIILGDAVHPENEAELLEMDSSLLMMDVIVRLMRVFPGRVIYLRGNHDTFSSTMTKGGVSQGSAWRAKVMAERGEQGVELMQAFYDRTPYVATGKGFVACHAGPPRGAVTRKAVINIHKNAWLAHQLTWSRVYTPRNAGGYTKRDVRALVKALGAPKQTALVVSHNPKSTGSTAELKYGGIKRHILIYSASRHTVSVLTRFGDTIGPLTYPARAVLQD